MSGWVRAFTILDAEVKETRIHLLTRVSKTDHENKILPEEDDTSQDIKGIFRAALFRNASSQSDQSAHARPATDMPTATNAPQSFCYIEPNPKKFLREIIPLDSSIYNRITVPINIQVFTMF